MPAEEATIERKNAWIDGVLVQQAKTVAAHDGSTVSEVLEKHLRGPLAKEVARVAAELTETSKAGA